LRRCEFVGALSADAVRDWMRRAAVMAAPSVVAANGDSEGLCLAVCEAQAMGIPVAGFRGPGIAVVDGETGVLVPQRDAGALADALITLLRDEALAARMGAAGRARVERLFNLRRQTALLEDKYDEVLHSPKPRVLR
jgi:glycosyltransferase involved in cell wall biosynthesis